MFLIWILTAILQSAGVSDAILLWHWFGQHVFLTVLMIIFLG